MLDQTFRRVVAAESVAAIVVEPVLGEGGFVVPPAGFLPALAEICRERGIVFVADEVQTGFGRTGELFACTHFGIEPDLIITAKSLGGGMPLAAITGRAEIMDAPGPGGLGGTFGGSPACCAAALAVLEELMASYWRVPERWAIYFNGGPARGNGGIRLSVMCAVWAPCRQWSLSMPTAWLVPRR